MADQKNLKRAKTVFNTICIALDNKDWKYEKNEDDLVITLLVSGDDLPMGIIIAVDADRQLIRLLSPIPSKFLTNYHIQELLHAVTLHTSLQMEALIII